MRKGLLCALALSCMTVIPMIAHAENSSLTITTSQFAQTRSIPAGAQRVPMLTLELTASCDDHVNIESFSFEHQGLGRASDIERIYLAEGNSRISRATRFSRDDIFADLRVRSFLIPACTTKMVTLLADYASTAAIGSEHQIVLDSENLLTDASLVTIQADTEVVDTVARTVPSSFGSITFKYLSLTAHPWRYGSNRVLQRFQLIADNETNHHVESITFTNDGKARDSDLRNLYIANNSGERLSTTVSRMNDDKVAITFSPSLVLNANQTKALQLRGDIRSSRTKTIQFELEEPSDIVATPFRGRSR